MCTYDGKRQKERERPRERERLCVYTMCKTFTKIYTAIIQTGGERVYLSVCCLYVCIRAGMDQRVHVMCVCMQFRVCLCVTKHRTAQQIRGKSLWHWLGVAGFTESLGAFIWNFPAFVFGVTLEIRVHNKFMWYPRHAAELGLQSPLDEQDGRTMTLYYSKASV